jgi:hypothetical protein
MTINELMQHGQEIAPDAFNKDFNIEKNEENA